MVNLPLFIIPESVHVSVKENNNEREEEIEEQPHVNHLHVGGFGQIVTHVDEHRGQYQHGSQVHSDNSLKRGKRNVKHKNITDSPRKKRL